VRKEGEAPPIDDFVKIETPASKQRDTAAQASQTKPKVNGTFSQAGSTRTSSETSRAPPRPAAPAPAPARAATPAPPTAPAVPVPSFPEADATPAPNAPEREKEDTLQAAYKACEYCCQPHSIADVAADESKRRSQPPSSPTDPSNSQNGGPASH